MILQIIDLIVQRQILGRLSATPITLTAAQAASDLRSSYGALARSIADDLRKVEKSDAEIMADETLQATLQVDSVYYSTAVNDAYVSIEALPDTIATVYNTDPDPVRKARWTLAKVRALFGLA